MTEEIEIADKSENIEEQVIERESNLKEFHPVSIGEVSQMSTLILHSLFLHFMIFFSVYKFF